MYLPKEGELPQGVGMGVLVDNTHIVTCAHVVCAAKGQDFGADIPLKTAVNVTFPFVDDKRLFSTRLVDFHKHSEFGDELNDIAVLKLRYKKPPNAKPIPLLPKEDLFGKPFMSYGYPEIFGNQGVWAHGTMVAKANNNRLQIEQLTIEGTPIEAGFSGTAAWCDEDNCVVGIVSEFVRIKSNEEASGVSYVIPTEVLTKSCGELKQAVDTWVWDQAAEKFQELRSFKDVERCCKEGLAVGPENLSLLEKQALCLERKINDGQYELAEDGLNCVNEMLKQDRRNAFALGEKGFYLSALGVSEALQASEEEIKKHNEEAKRHQREAKRYFRSAINYFNRSLKSDSKYTVAYSNLGQTRILLEQYDKAIEPLDKALVIDPQNSDAWH
ncbi:MAG: tetratricopeptide repeat-containing S1 family peptidase, partial [Halobacteriota archaeon]